MCVYDCSNGNELIAFWATTEIRKHAVIWPRDNDWLEFVGVNERWRTIGERKLRRI